MRRALTRSLLALGCCGLAVAATPAAAPIRPEQFDRLQALIRPSASEEKWTAIPWLSSLWDARRQAAAEGKPILLWEMDGNPLGCT